MIKRLIILKNLLFLGSQTKVSISWIISIFNCFVFDEIYLLVVLDHLLHHISVILEAVSPKLLRQLVMIHLLFIQVCFLLNLVHSFVLLQQFNHLCEFILLLNKTFKNMLFLKFVRLEISLHFAPSLFNFFHFLLEVFFVILVS